MTIQIFKGVQNQELVLKADYDKLAAECAALKAGPQGFFSYGSDSGYQEFSTAKEAIESAEVDIDYYRDGACDGWSDETDQVCWGIVMQRSTMVDLKTETSDDGVKKESCDYALLPSIENLSADAAIAEFKAQGLEILTGNLQRLIDEGMFDAKEIVVISGAIYEGAQIAANLRAGVKP